MAMHDSHFDLCKVGEMPHQPVRHSFLKHAFGKTKVSSRIFKHHGLQNGSSCTMPRQET